MVYAANAMIDGPDSRTLSSTEEPKEVGDTYHRPHLFLVLEAHRPLAPPARVSLAKLDELEIGRGSPRQMEATNAPSARRLTIRADDRRMSSTHARLGKLLQRWVLDDAKSKNGTFVNGIRTTRDELEDGDLIELGQTFFLYREALPCDPNDPPVLDRTALRPAAPGLATVLPQLHRVFERLVPIARSTISVILEGETGTGKEVMARALHALSGRPGDFVAVNCGALPKDLVEAELFGHKKGAFSGATEDRLGLVRSADRGTLFLDEIGDLPAPAQAALLRTLQEREVRPIGGTRSIAVDLRVIAATHRSLERMVAAGAFRADLWNRLAGHKVELPPLRARREDLGLLAGAILARLPPDQAARIQIHPRAARAMLRHDWPGNVRELEKCLGTAVVLAGEGGVVELEHLPPAVQRALEGLTAEEAALRDELIALLKEQGGNITAVAKAMGKARMQVQRWLKRFGIDPTRFRR
ncbi:sigma 54-interacting transcriptional regulator [Polyangium mundeleinium]|uniref:Sigma 54-interacting transcriptional regulator n=1 Tax=Polyangium mundeleinium TaxID=2995306 RepID=A0ABT5EY39_9BACT|nr:sigma 54-interacting transcriptional regulator [Polyangium mundeleinium]MDC0746747.1 sigma 54-interacting transcriptional regulator [Polyangium mundeleinium]